MICTCPMEDEADLSRDTLKMKASCRKGFTLALNRLYVQPDVRREKAAGIYCKYKYNSRVMMMMMMIMLLLMAMRDE